MIPRPAIALLSAAALAYQVLLVRAFSISLWHHFAYMIISLALLGYGASGVALSLTRERLLVRPQAVFAGCAACFAVLAPAAYAISRAVPLNLLELPWDPWQALNLFVVYTTLAVPFFFAACGVGLALTAAPNGMGMVYSSDLVGAGLGALVAVAFLFAPSLDIGFRLVAAIAAAAAVSAGWRLVRPRVSATLLAAGLVVAMVWPAQWLVPKISPYKEMSLALNAPGARVIAQRSSPIGLLSVVESPIIPFRHAPGLSLKAQDEPPEQLAIFTDGSGLSAVNRFDGRLETIGFLDQTTAALPYHILKAPRVAILGSGGGSDVLLARLHGAQSVDAVEMNAQLVELIQGTLAGFAGNIYGAPPVTVHISEARQFMAATDRRYDLVQVTLLDSFGAAASGVYSLHESFVYTLEAFENYLRALTPDGVLAVTRWVRVPPRDSLKVLVTAIEALQRIGAASPGDHLAMVRGWNTVTIVIKRAPLTAGDIAGIRRFCQERDFDVVYTPGLSRIEDAPYNRIDGRPEVDSLLALLGPNRDRFIADYRFDISPARDDRPYFFHFLKWSTFTELMGLPQRSGFSMIEWGYPVLIATLAQALLGSLVLILLPVWAFGKRASHRAGDVGTRGRLGIVLYFCALGVGFMFIEIAFIQRLQLLLGHPVYAVAVALAGFLVFAGIGSAAVQSYLNRLGGRDGLALALAVGVIAAVAVAYLVLFPSMLEILASFALPLKIAVALLLIAPLAFFMGMPFPIGLSATSVRAPALVPWAWGINGCASVVAPIVATLVAIHFGFQRVVLVGLVAYGIAAVTLPRLAAMAKPLASPTED